MAGLTSWDQYAQDPSAKDNSNLVRRKNTMTSQTSSMGAPVSSNIKGDDPSVVMNQAILRRLKQQSGSNSQSSLDPNSFNYTQPY